MADVLEISRPRQKASDAEACENKPPRIVIVGGGSPGWQPSERCEATGPAGVAPYRSRAIRAVARDVGKSPPKPQLDLKRSVPQDQRGTLVSAG